MDNDQVVAVNDEAAPAETAEAPKKTTRTRRKAAPKVVADVEAPAAEASTPDVAAEVTAAPARRTRSRKKVEPAEPLPGLGEEAAAEAKPESAAEPAPEKPVRRRRTAKPKAEAVEAPAAAAVIEESHDAGKGRPAGGPCR